MSIVCPLLTRDVARRLHEAVRTGADHVLCTLDLGRTQSRVEVTPEGWQWQGRGYPLPGELKERTVYWLDAGAWQPVARFRGGLVKLVPTDWGPPTFEIDGIKMLPTAHVSPLEDARRKVALVEPSGRTVLDTCGGLGYFAACCLERGAARIHSFEKDPDVLWLRTLNPWSPGADPRLLLTEADVATAIEALPAASFDALLHDPPRFGIAGELYSQRFYDQLARVARPRARLFHYTGTPNRLTSGRDVPGEVLQRLQRAGFDARREGDGLYATRRRSSSG
jgi:predicted methyltransferase